MLLYIQPYLYILIKFAGSLLGIPQPGPVPQHQGGGCVRADPGHHLPGQLHPGPARSQGEPLYHPHPLPLPLQVSDSSLETAEAGIKKIRSQVEEVRREGARANGSQKVADMAAQDEVVAEVEQ